MYTNEILEEIPEKKASSKEALRKVLLENEMVRVTETYYPEKGTVLKHQHIFPYVLYAVEGGTVEITSADGEASRLELLPGQALWRKAQSHNSRNVGSATFRIVEVEVKNGSLAIEREKVPRVAIPGDFEWVEDKMDSSRKSALLVGDPTRPGPYTTRFHAGAHYTIGLHRHPAEDENLTVISGSVHWSTGAEGSLEPEHVLPAGGFVFFPAGTPHRLWTTEETELQLTGIGPHIYEYLSDGKDSER